MAFVDDAGRDLLMFLVGSLDEAEEFAGDNADLAARVAADRELLSMHVAINLGGVPGCAWCTTAETVVPWPCDVVTDMARRYGHPHYL